MNRTVREYTDADLDGVLTAWDAATRLAHPFMDEAFLAQERRNIPDLYLPNAETWVIEQARLDQADLDQAGLEQAGLNQQGQVIGFIALIGDEIGAVFVLPALHGTGAGRALMDKARAVRRCLEVEVFEANTIGRGFYEKCGFVFVSEQVHEPTGQVLLRLRLA